MLNEFIEFESYVNNPKSGTPRIQPNYLTDTFKMKNNMPLNGIDQVMTVIARGFLFDEEFVKESFDKDGLITDSAVSDVRSVLSNWCGFEEKEEARNSGALKKWLNRYPDADGWLKTYWKFWYKKKKNKTDGDEQWNKIADKWSKNLDTEMDFKSESYSFGNIIANAIEMGPLRERYCVIKKDEELENNKEIKIKKSKDILGYLDYNEKGEEPQARTKLKMFRNIIAFRILQEEHPGKQKEVLLEKLRLLGWYGNDDRDGKLRVWLLEQFIDDGKPIMYRVPGSTNDYVKYGIDEDYMDKYGFLLIDTNESEQYKDDYWILKDTGHGKDNPFEIVNLKD